MQTDSADQALRPVLCDLETVQDRAKGVITTAAATQDYLAPELRSADVRSINPGKPATEASRWDARSWAARSCFCLSLMCLSA